MATHSHSFEGTWPFQSPESSATLCCPCVFSGTSPILYVRHDEDGDWQFLCGAAHDIDSRPRLLCFGCVVERDPSILALADLPAGWGAQRESLAANWERAESPDDQFPA